MLLRWYEVYRKGDLVTVDGADYELVDVLTDYNLTDGLLITVLLEKCEKK